MGLYAFTSLDPKAPLTTGLDDFRASPRQYALQVAPINLSSFIQTLPPESTWYLRSLAFP